MKVVYIIKNNLNTKVYIGSSKNLEKRKKQHIYLLNKNKHHSVYLQNFFNKNKNVEFTFEILCSEESDINLLIKEQEFINIYKSYNPKFGFNEAKVVKNSKKYNPVYQYNTNGKFIKKWESVDEICNKLKLTSNKVYRSINKNLSIENFYLSYNYVKTNKVKYLFYVSYDLNGKLNKIFNSLQEIKIENDNINKSNIIQAIKTNQIAYGSYWKKFNFYIFPLKITIKSKKTVAKKISKYCKYTKNFIESYNSLKEAALSNNISVSSISRCLSNSEKLKYYKSTKNFIWKLESR